ncbi:ABC transporter ATP-binding protein [Streptacidiphilus sp. P02-A3a]|uniref:ABC transporter ATP-binding protein n=1 Tax=Streptacidiphilus sp. P02-A3a TaxID=2704468 RepID=UPI001CDC01CD|nr:ABC transporter ATP-binding protein [Streptacidiphilus sp. P02-A3a]
MSETPDVSDHDETGQPDTGADGGGRRPVVPRVVALLRPEWSRLAVVAVLTVGSVGFIVVGPWLLGRATNLLFDGFIGGNLRAGETKAQVVAGLRAHGQGHLAEMLAGMDVHPGVGVDLDRLGQVLGLVALVYLASTVFSWAQARILTGVAQRTMFRLRQQTEEKLTRLPLRYFDTHPHGDILSRVINDIDNVDTTLQEGLNQLPTSLLTVLGTLGIMFWISPLLATVSLVTIPVVMTVTFLIARRSKTQFAAQWEQTGQLTSVVEETYAGHALVLAYGQRKSMAEEFGRQNDRLLQSGFRAQFLSGAIFPAVVFVGNLNYVFVAAVGGFQVATGVISLGAVQAFVQYSQRFTSPVIQVAGQMNVLQSGIVSAGRVFEFLDAPEEPVLPAGPVAAEAVAAAPVARRVRLENVSFRYQPDTPLIEDFTLEAAPGQTVAIVGPTGAGKTTVVNLLVRFYEIDGGRILLDGTDYRELSRDQVRRCFGMVLQDTWLFHGTIRDNIGYGRADAGEEEILAAARAAHVDDFVRALPDGYRTVLDGDAANISAGQRQLLTIARAFLADPGILILDEATSNVDTRTEAMIQEAMARLQSGRTSFVIAHRLSTIQAADTIVVMDAGRVVEQGPHQELLDRRGFYHELYHSQFAESVDVISPP